MLSTVRNLFGEFMNVMIKKLLQGQAVEWQALGEVANLNRGRVMSKTYLADNIGEYPVYSSQTANNGEIGKINTFDFEGEFITWTTDGANAGTVFYRNEKFSITNVCGLITLKYDYLTYKFLFYWLSIQAKKHVYSGMGNPKLMSNQMEKIQIPIPPLSVQSHIVQILDTFTELTDQLTAELTAEFGMRQKQYQYYRDLLLSEHELAKVGFEWKSLGEVGELVRGNGLTKKDLSDDGVPAIHYGQIYTRYGLSTEKTLSFVSTELAKRLRKVDTGDVVITNTSENLADVGKSLVYLGKEQAVTGGHATIFKPNKQIILGKYFAYFTQTDNFTTQKRKYAKGTKVIDVSTNDMAKLKIPIPPLSVQSQIVAILDTFDTLTQSISEGLPKEIKLRQKQYEYYREQLLNFKATI